MMMGTYGRGGAVQILVLVYAETNLRVDCTVLSLNNHFTALIGKVASL